MISVNRNQCRVPVVGEQITVSRGDGVVKAVGAAAGTVVIFVQGDGWCETTARWSFPNHEKAEFIARCLELIPERELTGTQVSLIK